jgi:hypothetical protein
MEWDSGNSSIGMVGCDGAGRAFIVPDIAWILLHFGLFWESPLGYAKTCCAYLKCGILLRSSWPPIFTWKTWRHRLLRSHLWWPIVVKWVRLVHRLKEGTW